jgi:hypothetical protein
LRKKASERQWKRGSAPAAARVCRSQAPARMRDGDE